MFSVYGTSGLMYRGPIDDVRKVAPSLRTARTRALQVEVDRDQLPVEDAVTAEAPIHPRAGPAQGAQVYAEVQHPPVQRRPLHTVADVMSDRAVMVAQDATLEAGWGVLSAQGIGQAPVVNAEGALVGLLTRAELMQSEHLPGPEAHPLAWRAWLNRSVADVMITPVSGVSADTELRRLALLLLETGLPGVPVVDEDGRVQGFVSRSDILKAVVHDPPLDLWAG